MLDRKLLHPAILVFALGTPIVTIAAGAPKNPATTGVNQIKVAWSIESGLGYDSNAFNAPSTTYIDYAAIPTGTNPTVTPRVQSGFFVPYKAGVEASQQVVRNLHALGSASVDGSLYLGGLGNANESKLELNGGVKYALGEGERPDGVLYTGVILEQHKQIYVDHDTGSSKTNSGGADISNRYSYSSKGVEANFKHKIGGLDYSIQGRYLKHNFADPVVVAQMDNTYLTLEADAEFHVLESSKLELSAARSLRDYSASHARKSNGTYSTATTPLLSYAYNDFGVTLRNRMTDEWLIYLDYDYSQRVDGYVNYNGYNSNRYGARVLYAEGQLKGRVALHHWARDYPNAFAFDVSTRGVKTYSGNDLKLKAEFAQTKSISFWAEAVYTMQNSTDFRYDYNRKQIMAGISWD